MLALTLSTACLFSCCHPFGAAKCHGYIGKYSELTGVAAIPFQPICMYTFYVQDELPMVCHNGVRTSCRLGCVMLSTAYLQNGSQIWGPVKCLKIKITKRSKPQTVVGHVVSQLTQLFFTNIPMDGLHCHSIARSILSLFFGRQLPPSQPEVGFWQFIVMSGDTTHHHPQKFRQLLRIFEVGH